MVRFNFITTDSEVHPKRAKQILKKYPQVREWTRKKNPWSFLIVICVVSLQASLAILFANQPWWVVLIVAFFFGTIINHTSIALVHEFAHDMVFKKKVYNLLGDLLVNIHMFLPSAILFKKYHLKHHTQMGNYDIDADIPSTWELLVVKNIWYRKFIWLLLFPLFQSIRTMRVKKVKDIDAWVVANFILTVGYDIFMVYYFGFSSLLYIAASFWFCFGFSVVGGRIIQEHFIYKGNQETYSYYGVLSLPSLHVGHHSEHHDFPSIPWNYLPKLRRLVPEIYEKIDSYNSWSRLVIKFIFDRNFSLSSRIIRNAKN